MPEAPLCVVVSVHDIASPLTSEVCHLLAALDAIGARPRVLKVVPNADGTRDLRDDPALVRVLAAEVAAGSEVVLHGYTHRVAGPLRGPWSTCLRARHFAGMALIGLGLAVIDGRIGAALRAAK